MEELSDTTHSPKKAKKSFSSTDRVSPVKSESPNKNALFNGTEHNKADDKAKENHNNSKVIKITKVSKTKTEQSSPGHCKSPKEESAVASSPQCDSPTTSAEECFLGFENVLLSDKQDILLKLLQKLGGSTENVSSSQLSPKKESETREEMTIADTHQSSDSESDHDSNQMEIDMGNDKETLSKADSTDFNNKNCLSGNFTKGVDVDMETDSVKSDSEKTSKNTDDKTLISNSSKLDTSAKGGQPKLEYCGSCSAVVDDAEEGICCDGNCERWFHLRCSGLSQAEYDELSGDENAKWACEKCSGKPPSIKADGKPLLSVRKDLGKISAPSPIAKRRSLNKDGSPRTPRIDISNPAFLKPFDFGWKRELVYRSTIDSMNRRQGDVYYYSPKGKKLRSLREISEHCGADLTQDNFTFWKEPLGIDDPNKEIIREAKIKLGSKEPGPAPVLPKKVITKITKTPKSLPKLTATVSPMESTAPTPAPAPAQVTPKASASVTPRVVFKGKTSLGPKFKITPSKNNVPGQAPKIVINKGKNKKASSTEELEIGMLPPTWDSLPKPKEPKLSGGSASARMEVCSIRCLPAMGLIPTLQCHVCLCLYHPECVGLAEANNRTIHSYKCKNCQGEKPKAAAVSPKATLPPPPLTPISTLSSSPTGVSHLSAGPPKLQRMMDGKPVGGPRARVPQPKTSSIVGGVTTWLPPSSTIQLRAPPLATSKFSPSQKPLPPTTTTMVDTTNSQPVQTLVSMDCKRFIIVPKHNVLSVSPATTSSAQVAEPVSTHVTTTASEQTVSVSSLPSQTFGPGGPGMPKSVPTSTAFIVSSSSSTTNTFQSPPGVLLVPYITPQVQPTQSEGQQQQYIVVNGPSGLQTGNFIIGNIPQQQQLKLPTVPTSQPAEPLLESAGVKRPVDSSHESSPPAKRAKTDNIPPPPSPVMQNVCYTYGALLHAFQYLKVQELLRASRVCHMWRDIALHKCLWETVRMKNSHVKDWEGFASTLRRVGARHLDLRKILVPDKPEAVRAMWADCVKALSKVNSLVKLDLCRCTSGLLEQIANVCPQLEYIAAGTLKSNQLNMTTLGACQNLTELKLKGQGGIELCNVSVLGKLIKLKHLSLTTMKNTANVMEVIGEMTQLESLELGDFLNVSESSIASFSQLTRLKRLRLEKGQADCPTDTILRTISQINSLVQLELINFDVKAGFEESLALCFNIRRLLIIPTYVTQSATTNHLVIEGVSKLASTLQHFVWGLTLELLRVTDLFIDQWEMNQKSQGAKSPNQAQQKKSASGDSIPILKPATKNQDGKSEGAVTQVDVLQLPKLHKVLTTLLPSTKIIILKVPFSATSRQTITGSPQ